MLFRSNTIIEELNQFSIDELAHKYKDTNLEQYVYKLSDFLEETNAYIKSQEIFTRKKVDNFNEEVLNLWLIVSYFCNMQCIYCLGNGGNYGRTKNLMSKETAIEAINLFWKRRNKKAKKLKVTFFGGEPLTNKDLIKYCLTYINDLCEHDGIKVKYMIDTNGTLIDEEMANLFKKNDFEVIVSIDGMEEIQNINRPLVNKKNSYLEVIKGLKILLSKEIEVTARITVTKNSVYCFYKTVCELWDMGFNNIYFDIVSSLDDEIRIGNAEMDILEEQLSLLTNKIYCNIVEGKNYRLLDFDKKIELIHKRKIMSECSFYNGYTYIVTPEKHIYNCFWLLGRDEFMIGTLKDRIANQKNRYQEDIKCKTCWAKRICGGGCLKKEITYAGEARDNFALYCREKRFLSQQCLLLYTRLIRHSTEISGNINRYFNDILK